MIGHLIARDLKIAFKDRGNVILGFAVPVVLFSVFVLIFGGMARSSGDMDPIRLIVVDEDESDRSRQIVSHLRGMDALRVRTDHSAEDSEARVPYTRDTARKAVVEGEVSTALVIPEGLSSGVSGHLFVEPDSVPALTLFFDAAEPLEAQVVRGLLQQVLFMGMSDLWALEGIDVMTDELDLGAEMNERMSTWMQGVFDEFGGLPGAAGAAGAAGTAVDGDTTASDSAAAGYAFESPIPIHSVDVLGETKKNPMAAMTAAQVVVMFLLFSVMFSAGSILREQEGGTLRRLLVSPMTARQFLLGKMGSTAIFGFLQIVIMFVYGWLVFKVDLFRDFPAVLLLTAVCALSATALGMVIASLCRTYRQIDSIATLVVLSMSAVGGSMVPRFLMPDWMQKIGLISFNAWAIDGYYKIFWREMGTLQILPQVGVLAAGGVIFFLISSHLFQKRFYT